MEKVAGLVEMLRKCTVRYMLQIQIAFTGLYYTDRHHSRHLMEADHDLLRAAMAEVGQQCRELAEPVLYCCTESRHSE